MNMRIGVETINWCLLTGRDSKNKLEGRDRDADLRDRNGNKG